MTGEKRGYTGSAGTAQSAIPGRGQENQGKVDYSLLEAKRKAARQKRIKRRRQRRLIFFLVLAIAGLAVGAGIAVKTAMTADSKNAPEVTEIAGIPVTNDLIEEGIPGRPGETRRIKFLVIHETGNPGRNANAASHNEYIHNVAKEKTLSWHYTVDDHSIYHHLPDNEIGYHAGDGLTEGGGNASGIGIEMCINPENDYETTLRNTAKLAAHLMKAYDLDIEDVKKHQDFSGKLCPENLINSGRWEEFIEMVKEERKNDI